MKLSDICDELGFTKKGNLYYDTFYLEQLDNTPYSLGTKVYVSDGVYVYPDGTMSENDGLKRPALNSKQLREEYEWYKEQIGNEALSRH